MGEAGYLEIEPRIVNQNHRVRPVLQDVLLAEAEIAQDAAQVAEHLHEAHDGIVPVVLDQSAADGRHFPSAPEPYVAGRVVPQQAFHQVGPMQVA